MYKTFENSLDFLIMKKNFRIIKGGLTYPSISNWKTKNASVGQNFLFKFFRNILRKAQILASPMYEATVGMPTTGNKKD